MSRIAYVNGRYVPMRAAMVHVEDRGYQFADGVYEVCEVRGGRLIDERRHLDRLERSLGELRIRMPLSRAALGVILREVAGSRTVRIIPAVPHTKEAFHRQSFRFQHVMRRKFEVIVGDGRLR